MGSLSDRIGGLIRGGEDALTKGHRKHTGKAALYQPGRELSPECDLAGALTSGFHLPEL